jgi:hypothetical protein
MFKVDSTVSVIVGRSYYLELPDSLLGWAASMSAATGALVIGLSR